MKSSLLAATAIVLCAGYAQASDKNDKWQPQFELEGRTNSDRSLVSPKFMIPLAQDQNSMLFTDIRTRLDDNNSEEYNLGLGYREIQNDWIIGGYGFIDYLSSANNFEYWQATAGLEALSEEWDIRANGYLPESTENSRGAGGVPGNDIIIDGGGNFGINTGNSLTERALPGFDFEAGYLLPVDEVDLRVFGGAYYFDASDYEEVTGPKARVEISVDSSHFEDIPNGVELTIGAQYQNDGAREDTTTALAQIRIPLGESNDSSSKLLPLEKRMNTFIERDVDVVAAEGSASGGVESASVVLNGQTYTGVDATIDANTADINATITSAGNNALIYFSGNEGDINITDSIEPLQGQTLLGAGSVVTATGLSSGRVVTDALEGTRPSIQILSGFHNGFRLNTATSNDIMIRGFDISNSGGSESAIFIDANAGGGDRNTLQDLNIEGFLNHGIDVAFGAADGVIRDVTVDGGQTGLKLYNTTNMIIDGATLTNQSDSALHLTTTDNLTVSDVTISGANNGVWMFDVTNTTGDVTINSATLNCSPGGTNTATVININGSTTCP